jgi:hypothetical protein
MELPMEKYNPRMFTIMWWKLNFRMAEKELKKGILPYYANEKNKNNTTARVTWDAFFKSMGAGFALFSVL